jgi:hypothetical protein
MVRIRFATGAAGQCLSIGCFQTGPWEGNREGRRWWEANCMFSFLTIREYIISCFINLNLEICESLSFQSSDGKYISSEETNRKKHTYFSLLLYRILKRTMWSSISFASPNGENRSQTGFIQPRKKYCPFQLLLPQRCRPTKNIHGKDKWVLFESSKLSWYQHNVMHSTANIFQPFYKQPWFERMVMINVWCFLFAH